MYQEIANFIIVLKNFSEEIQCNDIAQFRRLIFECNFRELYNDGFVEIYESTLERHKGNYAFQYTFQNGTLLHKTVIRLDATHD